MKYLRQVLIQDAAVIYSQHPDYSIFQHPPFNSNTFKGFSDTVTVVIERAEDEVLLQTKKLPGDVINVVHASLMKSAIHKEEMQRSNELINARISEHMLLVKDLTVATFLHGSTAKKRKAVEAFLDTPSGKLITTISYFK